MSKGSGLFSSPRLLVGFFFVLLFSTTRHLRHTDDKMSQEKVEKFTTIEIKETRAQRKEGERQSRVERYSR